MNRIARREALKRIGIGAGGAALAAVSPPNTPVSGDSRRPNIVFLLTDDLRYDALGCMGNSIIRTPNIDALARDGVLFRNAYVTTPICCSSRASILTGQYVRRHAINDFSTNFTDEQLNQTYPLIMRESGYFTGFVGKYGIGNTEETMPADRYDAWYGFPGQNKYEHTDDDGNYRHLTSILSDQSVDFIETCPDDRPFCLSVSFKAPHVQDGDPRQFIPDPAYDGLYIDDEIPEPKTATRGHFEALPDFLQESEARVRWKLRFATPEMYQRSVKNYYRLMTGVDDTVGRIMTALRMRGFSDNTVVIFTSDNGFYLGEHGLAGKWFGHEESVRVPMIIHDPRLPKDLRGRTREEAALNIDIAPTILSLAGVPVPGVMQGRDLSPVVNGESPVWRSDFLFEHHFDQHPLIAKSEGVAGGRYKYIVYYEREPVYEELYDLMQDPGEERNVARESNYRPILERMRIRLAELKREAE